MAKIIKYFPFLGADYYTTSYQGYFRVSNQSAYTDLGNAWGLWESSAWDPAPAVTLVFLAKVSGPTGYVALFNKTDNIQLSEDVQVSSTTWQLHESAAITMPAGDTKEFIVRAKKSAGDIDIVPLGLKIIQNATVINKTVTYIPLMSSKSGTSNPGADRDIGPEVHYYHEATKFDGTLQVNYEAIIGASAADKFVEAKLTKTDNTVIATVQYTGLVGRVRSGNLSLADLASYKTRTKIGTGTVCNLYHSLIIIKQTGGVTKTKVHALMDGADEQIPYEGDTYNEGRPNAHDWDPGDIDNVAAAYFEVMGKPSYPFYVKLRNHTNGSDITGSAMQFPIQSTWGRIRTADIFANLPTASKELRSHRKITADIGGAIIGNRFLIIEQSWVPTYTAKDAIESVIETVQEVKNSFAAEIAFDYNSAKDAFEGLVETIDTWTKDAIESVIGIVAEAKDAIASEIATIQDVKDAFGSDILLLDEEGPYIVAGTLSPAAGAKGVLPTDKVKFSVADNSKVKLSSIKCKLTPYQLNDAGGKIYKAATTYDYNSAGWSHVDVYGDGRRYDIEIDPTDFPDGHFVEREITADDEQGNPGLRVA